MQDWPSPGSNIRFGKFEVDLRQGELRRFGLRLQLGPQPFELLRALLERPGELITRDELRQRLWPGNTFVDYELGLKKCVNRIREVLGDSADHPRYIETLPRRGYRFIATLEPIDGVGALDGTPRARDAPVFEVLDGRRAEIRAEVKTIPAQPTGGALLDPAAADLPGEASVTRLRDIGEARVAIQNAGKDPPAVSVVSRQRTAIVWPGIAGVLLLFIAVLLVREWISSSERVIATPVRTTLELTPAEHLTNDRFGRPHHTAMAFSPDGKVLVFAGTAGTTRQLYKRPLDQAEAIPIPETEGGDGPFFSPDGKWLGFYADNSLKKVSTSGGPAVPICKLEYPAVWGAAWGADGSIVFAEHDLKQVSAQGGEPKVLLKANEGHKYASPEFLPDGRTLLFTNVHGRNWDLAEILVLPNGGSPRILLKGGASPRYASAGYLIYMRNGTLLAAPFDARHLEVTGPGVPLLDGVMQSVGVPHGDYESGIGQFAVSRLGTLVYAGGGIYPPLTGSIVRLDRSGAAVDLHFKDVAIGLRLSPDGRRPVATKVATNSPAFNVELYDLERGTSTPLTSDGASGWPIWSVDGQRVLFTVGCPRCETAAGSRIDSVAADGRGTREIVFNKEGDEVTAASW